MDTTVTEIALDVYRLSTWAPNYGIQFNQFVILDEQPTLVHTAFRKLFSATRAAVATLLDPARLRWVGYSHFEPDECGALNEWLAVAPQAEAVCGFVGAHVMLADFADRPPRVLADDEVVTTGRHRLRYLRTPHVPHCWDAGLLFDETTRTLFCSDLFFHPGNPEPVSSSEIVSPARQAMEKSRSGPMAHDVPYTPYTDAILRRLAGLAPTTLAVMHGSSFSGDGGAALRDLSRVFRELLAGDAVP